MSNLDADRISRALADVMGGQRVPGAQVGLLLSGERLVLCAGRRGLHGSGPVTATTRFHAGSLAKSLAAQLVLEAAAAGSLDLDIACSDQSSLTWDDTPRTLLTQTSGRPNELPAEDEPLGEFTARVGEMPRWHEPGRFSYCNAGWSALAQLLEETTGSGFEETATDRFGVVFGAGDDVAGGHGFDADGGTIAIPPSYSLAASAAGSRWWSTADGLLDHAERHLHPTDEAAPIVEAMRAPAATVPGATVGDAWGMGWMVWDRPDHQAFGWAGYTGGHRAYLRCFPDHDAALVFLANCAGPIFGPPGGAAAFDDLLPSLLEVLGVPPVPDPVASQSRFNRQDVLGQYGPLVVAAGTLPDTLVLGAQAFGEGDCTLERRHGDTWSVQGRPSGAMDVTFDGGDDTPTLMYVGPMAMPRVG